MAVTPPRPTLRKLRIRSFWMTLLHEDGTTRFQQRVYEVTGPTGHTVYRSPSFRAAVYAADRESRLKHWRDAAGVHECSAGALMRCRPVGTEGIYCGHGRFLGTGDWLTIRGTEYQLGQPTIAAPHGPSYMKGGVL